MIDNLNFYKNDILIIEDLEFRLFYFKELKSTNEYALDSDFNSNSIIIADKQTGGKGRQGRKWISDDDKNLYYSIILSNDSDFKKIFKLNITSAYAICDTIKTLYGINVKVKWPNDVIYCGKKLCGILLEAKMDGNKLYKLVVGIGVNLNGNYLDEEISKRATTLFLETGKIIDKTLFIKTFLRFFVKYLTKDCNISDKWNSYSAFINKEITFHYNNNVEKFIEKGINEDGALIVEDKFGRVKTVYYGEIGYDFGH
ncbi:biotin--[acetyl-CoA-carboxylase] ligase [Deferribacter thermophilus]|uniref:biotin--[acetyl-CoA-carboxylase] ligase n=1 Tax=Deferribacter thermophilus TaxID=53573 RepID=UPI003C23583B